MSSSRELRLVSDCGFLLRFGADACKSCTSTRRVWKRREEKRRYDTPCKYVNTRFLSRRGLEARLCDQNKERATEATRMKRAIKQDDMVELVTDDSNDLFQIMTNTAKNDVPPDMKSLWESQMKQLSAKSKYGNRWDPRLVFLSLNKNRCSGRF